MADHRLPQPLTSVVEVPHGYRVYAATHTWPAGDPLWLFLGCRLFRRSADRLARRWLRDEHVDRAVSAALARGHRPPAPAGTGTPDGGVPASTK